MVKYIETTDGARIYASLEHALEDIARRSFYEDATITPLTSVGAYMVTDDANVVGTDDWYWSREDGLQDAVSVSEASRLHEAYETYNSATHIRYSLPASVEALEEGRAVTFAYAIVTDLDADDEDNIAGWILTSIIHE